MAQTPLNFYDGLAEYYHLIFDDWDASIARQARVLNPLLRAETPGCALKVLDCACGIGTQAIGFAQSGHRVVASDLSRAAVARAKTEAERRGLEIQFLVSDMTSLVEIADTDFDVVAALDNALPHLTPDQTRQAVRAIRSKLKPNGLFIAGIRDYDQLIVQRPALQAPAFFGKAGERRIVHQVWDWIDREKYIVHLYITTQSGETWSSHHFVTGYRCLLRGELSSALQDEGFTRVRWLAPEESGSYQWIVLARR
jgi:SAM-dependent methyltransferase